MSAEEQFIDGEKNDGSLESLKDNSRRLHYHSNQHTKEEIKLIKYYKRTNKDTGLVVLWVKLRGTGYKRTIQGNGNRYQQYRWFKAYCFQKSVTYV